ncbi:MAG: hypothetical protein NVSMB6_04630 [Burkholderiaceae bacterium]
MVSKASEPQIRVVMVKPGKKKPGRGVQRDKGRAGGGRVDKRLQFGSRHG